MPAFSGNPIIPGLGVCDPHIRIYNDRAYLYATHDKSAQSTKFVMDDWWIWSSDDLVNWKHEWTLRPEETYYGQPDSSCWAVDEMERDGKHYLYFSRGPKNIGVVVSDTPVGPWRDPLGRALLPEGLVPTAIRDPGLFKDDDGECYIVFGTFDFYMARLNRDMISLAEHPRLITIHNPAGPCAPGKTDDKPFLHKRNGIYYLSWGCFYSMSDKLYGPYDCKGTLITVENVDPSLHYKHKAIDHDRHGSFFEWRGQWYFICNEMGVTQNSRFRDSSLCYVSYKSNGEIEPLKITTQGVTLPGQ